MSTRASTTSTGGSTLLQFRILAADLPRLRRLAQRENKTLAEYVRAQLGVADPPRGGAREGAGRNPKPLTSKT
jgi:hypothetical protein